MYNTLIYTCARHGGSAIHDYIWASIFTSLLLFVYLTTIGNVKEIRSQSKSLISVIFNSSYMYKIAFLLPSYSAYYIT